MRRPCIRLLALFLFTAGLACKKEKFNPTWEADYSVPLIKTSLSIRNILADSLLNPGEDSSINLVYESTIYSLQANDIVEIPDTQLNYHFHIPFFSWDLAPGQVLREIEENSKYNLGTVKLVELKVKSGYLKINGSSEYTERTKLEYEILSAKKGGQPFKVDLFLPGKNNGNKGEVNEIYDLSGYTISLTGKNGDQTNNIYTKLKIQTDPLGKNQLVMWDDTISISNGMFDIVPSYIKGYFGQDTIIIGPEEIEFGMFNNIKGGKFGLEKLDMLLSINNDFGLDSKLTIKSIYSLNSKNNSKIDLTGSIINKPININRATESGNQLAPFSPTQKTIAINSNNSNIKEFIENIPDKLGYTISVITNPLGNISGSNDFVYSDGKFDSHISIEAPLSLFANQLQLIDTISLNLSSLNRNRKINSGTLYININNGFPLNANIQMFLLDTLNGTIIDSLFSSNNNILTAQTDINNYVNKSTRSLLKIVLDSKKTERLLNTKKMLIKTTFDTPNQPSIVKIYDHYLFDIKITSNFNYSIDLNDQNKD